MKKLEIGERRELIIAGTHDETVKYSAEMIIEASKKAIADHGFFSIALSGGSTPKLIYQSLSSKENRDKVEWNKVLLFWSDERAVPPDDPESNFHMAMVEGGLSTLPIPQENIFRMEAEKEIESAASKYEKIIKEKLGSRPFDFMMLGLGEDGHTASLFPYSEGLFVVNKLTCPNFIKEKNSWRMTLTFECINKSSVIAFFIMGSSKAAILEKVLYSPYSPDQYPSQRVGTPSHKALFILDNEASKNLLSHFPD